MVIAFAPAAVGAADAATSPKALRAAVLKAALAQHSVHYVTTKTMRAGATQAGIRARDVADVAQHRGIQRWTVSSGSGKPRHITFLVVHSTAYVRGDSASVLAWGGFPHLRPGKWFSIPHDSQIYPLIASNVTLGSFVRDVVPAHHLSLVNSTVRGRTRRALRGWARTGGGVLTLHLRRGGPPLPVEGTELLRGIEVGLGHVIVSDWNEPVHVRAPAHSSPAH